MKETLHYAHPKISLSWSICLSSYGKVVKLLIELIWLHHQSSIIQPVIASFDTSFKLNQVVLTKLNCDNE